MSLYKSLTPTICDECEYLMLVERPNLPENDPPLDFCKHCGGEGIRAEDSKELEHYYLTKKNPLGPPMLSLVSRSTQMKLMNDFCIEVNNSRLDLRKVVHGPVHEHDCESCHFLASENDVPGIIGTVDFYYCPGIGLSSLIARFSSDPSDYFSSPPSLIREDARTAIPYIDRLWQHYQRSQWSS